MNCRGPAPADPGYSKQRRRRSLASGQFEFMAAVMIGGMVPPLAIALCTTFFKKKFTAKERQSAVTNYIMGLSFITEGAIPFAAADPLRVIPACVVGSATAGALSMAFGCALRAPHGGIFVLPVITNPLGYFGALVIGSLVPHELQHARPPCPSPTPGVHSESHPLSR